MAVGLIAAACFPEARVALVEPAGDGGGVGRCQFSVEDEVSEFVDEDFRGGRGHDGEVVFVVCVSAEVDAVGRGLGDAWSVAGEFAGVGEDDGAELGAVGYA